MNLCCRRPNKRRRIDTSVNKANNNHEEIVVQLSQTFWDGYSAVIRHHILPFGDVLDWMQWALVCHTWHKLIATLPDSLWKRECDRHLLDHEWYGVGFDDDNKDKNQSYKSWWFEQGLICNGPAIDLVPRIGRTQRWLYHWFGVALPDQSVVFSPQATKSLRQCIVCANSSRWICCSKCDLSYWESRRSIAQTMYYSGFICTPCQLREQPRFVMWTLSEAIATLGVSYVCICDPLEHYHLMIKSAAENRRKLIGRIWYSGEYWYNAQHLIDQLV